MSDIYAGIAPASGGVNVVGTATKTNQTASIGSTTLYAMPTTGMYRVSYVLMTSATGTGGTVTLTVVNGYSGLGQTTSALSLTAAVGTQVAGDFVLWATGGNSITYSTTVSGGSGSFAYRLDLRVEPLS
ncbi:MAG TPA: hypothetical protein VN577_10135 [Terriglobales bacterium]|nr:hypothetical protein [Terriglobales bacterium]